MVVKLVSLIKLAESNGKHQQPNPIRKKRIWMKINREDYPKLHLDTNYNKGTACNRKVYGCK
jgi:hypothetical protein